jgi:hypothetical protein
VSIGSQNQHHSEPSHSVLIVFGRSLNQRVLGSLPGLFTSSDRRICDHAGSPRHAVGRFPVSVLVSVGFAGSCAHLLEAARRENQGRSMNISVFRG